MKKHSTPVGLFLLLTLDFGLWTDSTPAQSVPSLINYQGRLSNPDGSPLATADYQLSFKIYTAPTGGARLWGPQIFDGSNGIPGHGLKIPVVQGYFNVMLGPEDTSENSLADAFNGSECYVEITISNHPPILPRQRILTAPFAFQAVNSAKLAGYDWSVVFTSNSPANGRIPGTKLANGTVTSNQIAPATILGNLIAPSTISLTNLFQRPAGTNVGSIAVSSACNNFVNDTTTPTDVTNLSVSLCTSGRPVVVFLTGVNGPSGGGSVIARWFSGTSFAAAEFRLLRDGVSFAQHEVSGYADNNYNAVGAPCGSVSGIDFPPAGCHTYKLQSFATTATTGSRVISTVLVAFEL